MNEQNVIVKLMETSGLSPDINGEEDDDGNLEELQDLEGTPLARGQDDGDDRGVSSTNSQTSDLSTGTGRPRERRSSRRPPPPMFKPSVYVSVAAAMAALGGILFGYDVGIISGALLQLRDEYSLSCIQKEMLVSSMLIGALLASLTGGFMVDHCGRRWTIIFNACIFIVGALVLATAVSYRILILGRLIVGFGVSLSAIAECVYISEISPPHRRGLLVSLNELGITLGFLLAYLIDYAFIELHNGWRFMFGLSAIAALIQAVGMFCLPQSPRFLLIKKRESKARYVLEKLRGPRCVDDEVTTIKQSLAEQQDSRLCDLCGISNNMLWRLMIGMVLVALGQFTGQPNVLYYAPIIFEAVGFHSATSATLATVGLGTIKVTFTAIALLTIDKVGRRLYLLIGVSFMMVSIIVLGGVSKSLMHHHVVDPCANPSGGATFANITSLPLAGAAYSPAHPADNQSQLLLPNTQNQTLYRFSVIISSSRSGDGERVEAGDEQLDRKAEIHGKIVKWVGLVSLMFYVSGYAMGFGPVTWLILSEIFPTSLKGRAISLATVFNWGANLLISMTFLDVMSKIGIAWTFIGYGMMCAVSIVFIYFFVPETKGRTLEEIASDLRGDGASAPPALHYLTCCKKKDEQGGRYQRVALTSTASHTSAPPEASIP